MVLIVPSVCALAVVNVGMTVNDIELQDLEKGPDPPPIVTLAEFERIQTSMSYQEVVDVIGDPGFVAAPSAAPESDDGDVETSMYVWQNSDASNMNAIFRNDQLVKKAQLYLK
jgi:hypothetical protein